MNHIFSRLRLDFPNKTLTCTSAQMKMIIGTIKSFFLDDLHWICADVTTDTDKVFKDPNSLWSTINLEFELSSDFQFLSGVFICMKEDEVSKLDINFDKIYTENSEEVHFDDCLLEIRAFDTSYFEIYLYDDELRKLLKEITL